MDVLVFRVEYNRGLDLCQLRVGPTYCAPHSPQETIACQISARVKIFFPRIGYFDFVSLRQPADHRVQRFQHRNRPIRHPAVRILLAENGFVTVLKQMTVTIVSSVEGHGIPRQEPSHYRRYGHCACTKEVADMAGDQGPSITACRGLF
jgi:hypothetical protein